jgi:hypothetical protein
MLIYVLRWWPSWISDRHKKHTLCRGPSNDHSWTVWFQFKAKLYMNVHWMVLYKIYVFCSNMKFKMAATAGLSLTLEWKRNTILNSLDCIWTIIDIIIDVFFFNFLWFYFKKANHVCLKENAVILNRWILCFPAMTIIWWHMITWRLQPEVVI